MNHPKGEESTRAGESCSPTYHLSSKALYCGRASTDRLRPGRTFEGPKGRDLCGGFPALFSLGGLEELRVPCRGAQLLPAKLGHHAAARRALEEAQLQEVRLVDVLDRVLLLAERNRQGREADRPAAELPEDRAEQLAVDSLEPVAVHLE